MEKTYPLPWGMTSYHEAALGRPEKKSAEEGLDRKTPSSQNALLQNAYLSLNYYKKSQTLKEEPPQ